MIYLSKNWNILNILFLNKNILPKSECSLVVLFCVSTYRYWALKIITTYKALVNSVQKIYVLFIIYEILGPQTSLGTSRYYS